MAAAAALARLTAVADHETQVGSYVLMDGRYGTLDLPFEPALYCVTTVISRRPSRPVLNVGLKELTVEYGMPGFTEWEVDGRRRYRLAGPAR